MPLPRLTPPDLSVFDAYTLDRMWMESGYYGSAHERGVCPEHCPLCRGDA